MPLPKAPTKKGSLLTQPAGGHAVAQTKVPTAQHAPSTAKKKTKTAAPRVAQSPAQHATMTQAAAVPSHTPTTAKPVKTHTAHTAQAAPTAPAVSQAPVTRPPLAHSAPVLNAPAAKNHKRTSKTSEVNATRKLFVLDTNVMLHDPSCFFRFEEHDVYLPLITLEELDNHKKGTTETARHGRQVSRMLDQLMSAVANGIDDGVPLNALDNQSNLGRLFFQTQFFNDDLPKSLPSGKADNQILGVVHGLQQLHPDRSVVLVSKDINMRIKARALGLNAEDYFNDQVIQDSDVLYSGQMALPADFWENHSKNLESWQEGGHTFYRIEGPLVAQMSVNEFVFLEQPEVASFYAQIVGIEADASDAPKNATLRTLIDYSNPKHGVWGIGARNREQNFALNVLMDPDIDFVTLLGQAGTGKTLVTIAAALQQTLESARYSEVIITRITVPVGEDIGFLPGTEEEKMTPWMGALQDNLEILIKGDANAGEWARAATNELIKNKVKIKAMSFMRGRTFVNKLLILDEAQNLTPKQMKTLITRAGPGTKVVCLGNLAQIDTPYLTEGSSGLAYVVEHFKGWPHSAHITLMRGERSRLADHANEVL
ncbi:PhoH-like protein [Ephemeroptericola cinctiostellae]|uniref:PhoH-like protein n=1 Tax=Ephemeroptericola cinctiostellae TaxID=2268024 RepID=A0A345DCM0_9BURK|nr:PhoH family protein [Ephemeroptericola cinctiostellae]AXF86108.1 PhoH-like protein [Ephemeroptericola cinctiostellae]